ncbi:unnamed protein product [Durusdinium trenchii]|uniref:Uncharacterized protein n=1 Tax=Durusdinium trenchii TaxID=1381693 RepID=A0ABP0L406_9DINO
MAENPSQLAQFQAFQENTETWPERKKANDLVLQHLTHVGAKAELIASLQEVFEHHCNSPKSEHDSGESDSSLLEQMLKQYKSMENTLAKQELQKDDDLWERMKAKAAEIVGVEDDEKKKPMLQTEKQTAEKEPKEKSEDTEPPIESIWIRLQSQWTSNRVRFRDFDDEVRRGHYCPEGCCVEHKATSSRPEDSTLPGLEGGLRSGLRVHLERFAHCWEGAGCLRLRRERRETSERTEWSPA